MKQYLFTALCAATAGSFLCSCSGTYEAMNHAAGLGVIKTKKSTFDGNKTISMTPSLLYRKEIFVENLQLGATWSASQPKYVGLHLIRSGNSRYGRSYVGI